MSTCYLLDSNILIAALKGQPTALLNRMAGLATERLCLSALVLGELLTGAEKSRDPAGGKIDVMAMTHGMETLQFDTNDAATYARIRVTLERAGTTIGPMDLLIAAQALSRKLVMVTDNLKEFQRVPGLKCENWLK